MLYFKCQSIQDIRIVYICYIKKMRVESLIMSQACKISTISSKWLDLQQNHNNMIPINKKNAI